MVTSNLIEAIVSIKRLSTFLEAPELQSDARVLLPLDSRSSSRTAGSDDTNASPPTHIKNSLSIAKETKRSLSTSTSSATMSSESTAGRKFVLASRASQLAKVQTYMV